MPAIQQARILIMATDGYEQSELMEPLKQLKAAGATVEVATPGGKPIKGWKDKNWGDSVEANLPLDAVDPAAYDALVLPGGQINPDTLRLEEAAVKIVKAFDAAGKVVAAICHGPILLIEADVVRGRTLTSYPSIRTDLRNAGANWKDETVVVDKGLVTSRNPGDLDAFVRKIIEEVGEKPHGDRR